MRTVDEIYESLCESFSEASGVRVSRGGDMALRLYAVASEVYALEAQSDFVRRQAFPQTASGEFLDHHAQLRGLRRGAALRAQGILRFALSGARDVDLEISSGVYCVTQAGMEFLTTEDAVILAGETFCDIAAEAVLPGASGNAAVGSVAFFKLAPIGVSFVKNAEAFFGGADEESDDSLRERVVSSYRLLPNGANSAYYVSRVLDTPDVAAVCVLPKERGIGTVDIVFSAAYGVPDGELVEKVAAVLEAEREICVDVLVRAPETRAVDLEIELWLEDGVDFAAVEQAARETLSGIFGGRMLGRSVYLAAIGAAVFAVPGVSNYKIISPGADVLLSGDVLPTLGSIVIREAVL